MTVNANFALKAVVTTQTMPCLLYASPSPRDS